MDSTILNERRHWTDGGMMPTLIINKMSIEAEKNHDDIESQVENSITNEFGPLENEFDDMNNYQICGMKIRRNTKRTLQYALAYVVLLVVGGAIFNAVEHPHELREHDEYEKLYKAEVKEIINILNNHNYTGVEEDTEKLYDKLMEHSAGFSPAPTEFRDNWSFRNSVIFSFTIITTIGYGNIAPETQLGQFFVVLYALVGIPLAGMSLIFFAERALYIFTWLSKIGTDKVEQAFRHFDEDGSGLLEWDEFKQAVKMLGFDLTPAQFTKFWNQVDADEGGTIELDEFRQAIELMNADVTETAGQKNKVVITSAALIIWLIFGIIVFKLVEGWTWLGSLYFVIVSLLTIGLGDFVPDTLPGVVFLVSFAIVGLGLFAVLIRLVQMLISGLAADKRKQSMRRKRLLQNRAQMKKIPIFANMLERELSSLLHSMTIVEFTNNTTILKEGAVIDAHYILTRGTVDVSHSDSDEKQTISAPSFLSQSCFLKGPQTYLAEATYCANDNVEILSLNLNDWEMLFPARDQEISADVHVKDNILGSQIRILS